MIAALVLAWLFVGFGLLRYQVSVERSRDRADLAQVLGVASGWPVLLAVVLVLLLINGVCEVL